MSASFRGSIRIPVKPPRERLEDGTVECGKHQHVYAVIEVILISTNKIMILPKGTYNHTGRRHSSGSWVAVVSNLFFRCRVDSAFNSPQITDIVSQTISPCNVTSKHFTRIVVPRVFILVLTKNLTCVGRVMLIFKMSLWNKLSVWRAQKQNTLQASNYKKTSVFSCK